MVCTAALIFEIVRLQDHIAAGSCCVYEKLKKQGIMKYKLHVYVTMRYLFILVFIIVDVLSLDELILLGLGSEAILSQTSAMVIPAMGKLLLLSDANNKVLFMLFFQSYRVINCCVKLLINISL